MSAPWQDDDRPIERVALLGFMCSGKSTVGAALARRLGWRFLDFDVEIERREGAPVHAVIDARGEDTFRAMEAALTDEVAHEDGLVIAPGGGWILQPELLESLRPGTYAAWLRVSPEETVRRLLADDIPRPLRDHPDPTRAIAELLVDRLPLFRRADAAIPAEHRSAEEIAWEIETVVRGRGAVRARD